MKHLYLVCQDWLCGINYLMICKTRKKAEEFVAKLPQPDKEDEERCYIEKVPYDNKKPLGN